MIQLPEKFIDTVPLDENEKDAFVRSLHEIPPVSVRINPFKWSKELNLEKVAWCTQGYYLPKRPVFTFDPVFHSGGYYVQEASSMIIGETVKDILQNHEIKIALDLCAAPGGKSTHLLSVLPEDSLLISNEVVSARLGALHENISKWGNSNVCIAHNNPSDFSALENLFDLILVDAPCSGEGMFRKEEAALTEWSLKNVEVCAIRQKNILKDVIPSLKPGGILIYSTCTYNERENEQNVKFLLDSFEMELFGPGHFLRFFPHRNKGEGLFVCVLRKKERAFSPYRVKKSNAKNISSPGSDLIRDFTKEKFVLFDEKGQTAFFPAEHFQLTESLRQNLRFYKRGTIIGTQKGKEFVPGHEMFLSNHFKKDSLPLTQLYYEEAIRYLSKEVNSVVPDHKGWGYFTYQNFPLGAYKSVPGRINNYFPKDLKIRKKYEETAKFSLLSL